MDKINVAELLKGCPSGMELDCTMYENVYFDQIFDIENCLYSIGCYTIVDGIRTSINFTKFGEFNTHMNSKCLIFPKGKTTWEGFHKPFKDGDIVFYDNCVSIFKEGGDETLFRNYVKVDIDSRHVLCDKTFSNGKSIKRESRFATEEEKEKLFDAIKANGYKWNPETKTLDKLIEPKFKVGDKVRHKDDKTVITITGIKDNYYLIQFYNSNRNDYQNEKVSFKDQDNYELVYNNIIINTFDKLVEPKFKDGDLLYIYSVNPWICIYKEGGEKDNVYYKYVAITSSSFVYDCSPLCHRNNVKEIRHATEEEKEKLFEAIKDNGYKWDPETKTLHNLIEPKFKVGDTIRRKNSNEEYIITTINDYTYYYRLNEHCTGSLGIQLQDEYELVLDKFDINILVPFESRVLVRNDEKQDWIPAFWGCKRADGYTTTFGWCKYCIPYEGNEHLLETNDDCDEYFKTWKN